MDIAEVAKCSGLTTSALRYYEAEGLISSTGRSGLRRQYDESVIERLALINLGRKAGFSLKDIAGMFARDGKLHINRKKLVAKIDDIERTINQLTSIRDTLKHVAECPAPSHLDCRKFRQLLRIAAKRTD